MIRRLAKRVVRKVIGEDSGSVESPMKSSPIQNPLRKRRSLANIEAGCREIKERIEAGEPVQLLDVREPNETAQGVVEGALLIPLSELDARWEEVKDCNEIVCYCATGMRSLKAATFLHQKGL